MGIVLSEKKKPQDHKPKVEKVTVKVGDREAPGKRVKIDGVTVTVLDEALDDFELLDDLARLQEQEGSRLPSLARRLFGDDYKPVLDALRGDNGRVSIQIAAEFVQKVFEAINPNS